MAAYHNVLDSVDYATCPRSIEVGLGDEPYVRMEAARGIPLQDLLNSRQWKHELYDHVATVLAQALVAYVDHFAEPYWDFIFRNMFYAEEERLVTLLDFGIPRLYLPVMAELVQLPPLEVSLGSLVASSVFESARPKHLRRQREHRRAPILAALVLARVQDLRSVDAVRPDVVVHVARTAYRLASGHGGVARRVWYRTCGRAFARPATKFARFRQAARPGAG
jgi:hypothetical protein